MYRLRMFYQAIYQLSALRIPPYFIKPNHSTCHHYPLHFINPQASTNFYKYSFFPKTIREWNNMNGTIPIPSRVIPKTFFIYGKYSPYTRSCGLVNGLRAIFASAAFVSCCLSSTILKVTVYYLYL